MKKVFLKIKRLLADLFAEAYDILRANGSQAVKITQRLKEIVESPISDFVVSIIPTDIDNQALVVLRKIVPEVSFRVAVVNAIMKESEEPATAVQKIVEHLRGLTKNERVAFWLTFAAELTRALSDGKISFNEAVILSQIAYKELSEGR